MMKESRPDFTKDEERLERLRKSTLIFTFRLAWRQL